MRLDARPPLVDERLRAVAILLDHGGLELRALAAAASSAPARPPAAPPMSVDGVSQPLELHVLAGDDVLVGVVEVVVG